MGANSRIQLNMFPDKWPSRSLQCCLRGRGRVPDSSQGPDYVTLRILGSTGDCLSDVQHDSGPPSFDNSKWSFKSASTATFGTPKLLKLVEGDCQKSSVDCVTHACRRNLLHNDTKYKLPIFRLRPR